MTAADRYRHARFGKSGMVAAAHPLAVLAGLDALREGGNAMDACIVMAGVTSVVLPICADLAVMPSSYTLMRPIKELLL